MRHRIKNSLWLNLGLAVLALVALAGAGRVALDASALIRERALARSRAAKLADEKADYLRRMAEHDTPEAVEYRAKTQLNLKKPGETVVVVPEPVKKDQQASPRSGLLRMIRNFFAKIF